MQLRINYNNILFRREVKQIINKAFSGQLYELIPAPFPGIIQDGDLRSPVIPIDGSRRAGL